VSLLQQIASRLLQAAVDEPQRPVELLLVEAIRRSAMLLDITAIWRSHMPSGLSDRAGARCADLTAPAEPLVEAELEALLARLPILHFRRQDFARRVHTGDGLMVVFGRRAGDHISEVAVWIKGESKFLVPLQSAFQQELSHLTDLFYTIGALKGAQASRAKAELARETARLLSASHAQLLEPLSGGAQLLRDIQIALVQPWYRDDLHRMVESIAEWGCHLVLGSEIAVEELAQEPERAALQAFIDILRRLANTIPGQADGLPARLELLGQIMEAALPDLPRPMDWEAHSPPAALPLLGMWTELHAQASSINATGRAGAESDRAWARACDLTRSELPTLLVEWGGAQWHESEMIRNWMRLWFALQLLTPPLGSSAPDRLEPDTRLDSERWRFRTDLALVLRESLRFALYGSRPTHIHQPGPLTEALATLVDHHARLEGGLPREQDVRGHLTEIGAPRGVDSDRFAAGHLQHVLEVYIAGHFFCALHLIGRPGEPARLVDVLASRSGLRPGQQARREFLAAFSLTALFHDVGMLLFPRYTTPTEDLFRTDRGLRDALGAVQESVEGAGRTLTEQCIRDLEAHECFDTISEPALSRWFSEQRRTGQPDHALLGAWYLLRICQRVDSLRPEVVRAAVRATLLHAAVGQTIDPDLDPAASLLVLCDELFDWDPSTQRRPLGDVRPYRSRAARLKLVGFAPVIADGELVLTLDLRTGVDPDGPVRCWPRVELRLQPPGTLQMPVFRAWLSMAQNLGRIRRSQEGFGANVRLHAAIPPRTRLTTKSTFALLERAIHHSRLPIRSRLQSWLAAQEMDLDEGEERFTILTLGRLMATESLRPHLPSIVEQANAVLEELERQQESR
jgi:hypothetical protein